MVQLVGCPVLEDLPRVNLVDDLGVRHCKLIRVDTAADDWKTVGRANVFQQHMSLALARTRLNARNSKLTAKIK